MDRCGWTNYPDGTTGCCLSDPHEPAGWWHCPHVLHQLTSIPRELIRRSDGRNVACVRPLRDHAPEGMSDADRGQA